MFILLLFVLRRVTEQRATVCADKIIIALALGLILSLFYLWRRDLVANMIGHFLVDLLANVHWRFDYHLAI